MWQCKVNSAYGWFHPLDKTLKTFSTKEAAEQYIVENKPCLSFKDIVDADPSLFYNEERNKRVLDKVKQKISQ